MAALAEFHLNKIDALVETFAFATIAVLQCKTCVYFATQVSQFLLFFLMKRGVCQMLKVKIVCKYFLACVF